MDKPAENSVRPTPQSITQMRLARCGSKTEDLYAELFRTPTK